MTTCQGHSLVERDFAVVQFARCSIVGMLFGVFLRCVSFSPSLVMPSIYAVSTKNQKKKNQEVHIAINDVFRCRWSVTISVFKREQNNDYQPTRLNANAVICEWRMNECEVLLVFVSLYERMDAKVLWHRGPPTTLTILVDCIYLNRCVTINYIYICLRV